METERPKTIGGNCDEEGDENLPATRAARTLT